jgi:hypothetical protein
MPNNSQSDTLTYINDEAKRRRILNQLNKGRAFRTFSMGFVITFQYVKAVRTGGVMSQPPEQKGEALSESTH